MFEKFLKMAGMSNSVEETVELKTTKIHSETHSENTPKEEKKLTPEQEVLLGELQLKVDNIINVWKDEEMLTMVLDKGYELNSKQAFHIMKNKAFKSSYVKQKVMENYEKELKHEVFNALNNIRNEISDDMTLLSLSLLAPKAMTIWDYVGLDSFLQDDSYAFKLYEVNKENRSYLLTTDILDNQDFLKYTDKINAYIHEFKKDAIKDAFMESLDKYSSVLNVEKKNDLSNDIRNRIHNFRESSLPLEARELLSTLRNTYKEIDKTKINVSQQNELDTFYTKRLPQVIEEYVTISPRYKEKLLQHNENPDSLLIDSLKEINQKVSAVFEDLQGDKLNRMKVTNHYLKMA